MKFYLLRTPDSPNSGKREKDPPLSTDELRLARNISRKFSRNPFGIRAIFCGSSLQCIQTADLVHDVLNVRLRVLSGFSSTPGEAENSVEHRVREAVDTILESPNPALIVSSDLVNRLVLRAVGLPPQKIELGVIYLLERTSTEPEGWEIHPA